MAPAVQDSHWRPPPCSPPPSRGIGHRVVRVVISGQAGLVGRVRLGGARAGQAHDLRVGGVLDHVVRPAVDQALDEPCPAPRGTTSAVPLDRDCSAVGTLA